MRKKLPQPDPVAAYQREAAAQRRVGLGAQCSCGESRPQALIPKANPAICAQCVRVIQGKSTRDNHHVAGKANDPTTIPVPVNDHRAELSVAQQNWPRPTLENLDRSPLLASAACIRGYADTDVYLINRLLLPKAETLEALEAFLVDRLGSGWASEFEQFRSQKDGSNVESGN
jgi:hypothetical protein